MKTPHELACAISALINSKPRSPTIEELEGVIAEHWKPGGDAVLVWKKTEPLAKLVGAALHSAFGHDVRADGEKGLREMKSQLRRDARVELQTAEEAARYRAHIEWLEEKAKAWNSLRGGSHD